MLRHSGSRSDLEGEGTQVVTEYRVKRDARQVLATFDCLFELLEVSRLPSKWKRPAWKCTRMLVGPEAIFTLSAKKQFRWRLSRTKKVPTGSARSRSCAPCTLRGPQ